ncbi:hypothetical protein NKG99_20525 [Mesorhizobium sp. M1409]|uniref:hypothetical protein n=1 Tax=Mesorhizobium sp. M1409 TaxID=2957100 RepID=UPI003337162C
MNKIEKVVFNSDRKFDIQLSDALIEERQLARIFSEARLHRIELKTETWQWEQTGNICIEFRDGGRPSGISTTEADFWVHQLKRPASEPGESFTLVYLMFPIERLKALARAAIKAGRVRHGVGDGSRMDVALVRLKDILQ